ncbi:unnamed protein product, partial [Brachionus calyciflorus]
MERIDQLLNENNILKIKLILQQPNIEEETEKEPDEELIEVPIEALQVELDNFYNEEEDVINKNNKRSKVRGVYILRHIFQTFESGVEFLMNDFEAEWSKERTRQTSEGLKECFNCIKSKNCKTKSYLLLNQDNESFSLRINNISHDHVSVKSYFCYGDLQKMIDKYSLVPNNEHEAFVIDSVIDVNSLIPSNTDLQKKFHPITLSICTNETHEEFEFIFSSIIKGINKVYNSDFRPIVLVADGADAITNGFMSAFGYNNVKWIDYKNHGWFEGFSINYLTTDNGLENVNGKIKSIHTLRRRLAVNVYLNNAFKMLRNWSIDESVHKSFKTFYNVDENIWTMAYDFLHSGDALIKKINSKDNTSILTRKEFSNMINLDFINKKYSLIKDLNFDGMVDYMKKIKIIKFKDNEWSKSIWSCSFFMKHYFCYHAIALAVNLKAVTIQTRYIRINIEPKAKV